MSNDFFSLRDLRNSRSKNFLDADDIPVVTFEDALETATGYHPWRHHASGGVASPDDLLALRRPVAAGKARKGPQPHPKQGHTSIEDFFAKRDRRKNRKEAGRLVPSEVARRIFEINAHQSAGDAPQDGEGARDAVETVPAEPGEEADCRGGAVLQVVKPPPDGWDPEAEGDGECGNDGGWFAAEMSESSRMQEDLRWEEGYSALQTKGTGAYKPPQLRQRQNERARLSEKRSFGSLQNAGAGEASAPDIGCLHAFPALGGAGGGSCGGGGGSGGGGGGWGSRLLH